MNSNDKYESLRRDRPEGLPRRVPPRPDGLRDGMGSRNIIPEKIKNESSHDDDLIELLAGIEKDDKTLMDDSPISSNPHSMNVSGMHSKIPRKEEVDASINDLDKAIQPEELNVSKESESDSVTASEKFEAINPKTLIVFVWVIIVVLISIIVAFKISKNKKDDKVTKNSTVNTLSIPTINTGADLWTDYMTVSKIVEVNSANIQCLLVGKAENYKKTVCVPVTVKEYNSVTEGSRIAIHFNELKLNGNNYINIISWEEVAPN